jgi:hypothetical protein
MIPVTMDQEYLIEAGSYSTSYEGDIVMLITEFEPCVLECPPGATIDTEPECYDEYVDVTNGGCEADQQEFGTVACGETICGTAGTYLVGTTNTRDMDWFELTITENSLVTIEANAEFDFEMFFEQPGDPDPCDDRVILKSQTSLACTLMTMQVPVTEPGTYWVVATTDEFTGVDCSSIYYFTVTCEELVAPENDLCDNAIDVGSLPASVTGTTVGASSDADEFDPCGIYSNDSPAVWYKVTGTGNTLTATLCNEYTDGYDWDTKISVYCAGCEYPICVGGNDDDYDCTFDTYLSTVEWCSELDTEYLIMVLGFGSDDYGNFQLDITEGTACADPPTCTHEVGRCCDYTDPYNPGCEDITYPECDQAYGENGIWTADLNCTDNPCEVPSDCNNPHATVSLPGDLPYTHDSTTCGAMDNYTETCLGYYDGDEDAIYELVVTAASYYHITMDPGAATWTGMAIDDSCPLDAEECLATASNSGSDLRVIDIWLEPGTYYIMIDIWPSPYYCYDFTLAIDELPYAAIEVTPDEATGQASVGGQDTEVITVSNNATATLDFTASTWVQPPAPANTAALVENAEKQDAEFASPVKERRQHERSQPDPNVILQGGDNCSDYFTLTGTLPITTSGTTVGYTNDYGGWATEPPNWVGSFYADDGFGGSCDAADVVYKWTAPGDTVYNFSLCTTTGFGDYDDTGLLLFDFTCPTEPVVTTDLIAGNDDAGCGSYGYTSELTQIPLTTGQEVLIVVDGTFGDAGTYELIVDYGPPTVVPPTCSVDDVAGYDPMMPEDDGWSFGFTDTYNPWIRYDNFGGAYGTIEGIKFWGCDADVATPGECDEDPMTITITFYYDDGTGQPGTVAYTETADITGTVTGIEYNSTIGMLIMKEYELTFASSFELWEGWISIQGTQATPDACIFAWLSSLDGDGFSWIDSGAGLEADDLDFSFCLQGTPEDPWLTIDVTEGTIDPSVPDPPIDITATMDATDLTEGVYFGAVKFNSNAAFDPNPEVPVTFFVGDWGGIYGNVTDGTDPLAGVLVEVDDGVATVVVASDLTDLNGDYDVYVPAGTYDVTFTLEGYEDLTVEDVVVTTGAMIELNAQLEAEPAGYLYLPGDTQMPNPGMSWPPSLLGADVTYLVNYYSNASSHGACLMYNADAPGTVPIPYYLFASADVNGDCKNIGGDVTWLVNYFAGTFGPPSEVDVGYCSFFVPLWPTPDDVPATRPTGWPTDFCLPPPVNATVIPSSAK